MQRGEQKGDMDTGFRCPDCGKSFYLNEKYICTDEKGRCFCPLCKKKRDKKGEIDG